MTTDNIRKFVNIGSFALLLLGLVLFFVMVTSPKPQVKAKEYLSGRSGGLSDIFDRLEGSDKTDSVRTSAAGALEALRNGTPTQLQLIHELRTLLREGKASSPEFQTKLDTLDLLMLLIQAEQPMQTSGPVFHDYLWPVMMLFFGGIIKFGLDWVLPQKKKLQ